MPVPAVVQTTHALGRPRNHMRCSGCYLLLTTRAPEGPVRAGAADPTDEPFAVAVQLPAPSPADCSLKIKPGVLTASAVGSGHAPIVAGGGNEDAQRISGEPEAKPKGLVRSLPAFGLTSVRVPYSPR